eukprot:jgi/Botrbrau1/6568/Bobra.40_2s0032.1
MESLHSSLWNCSGRSVYNPLLRRIAPVSTIRCRNKLNICSALRGKGKDTEEGSGRKQQAISQQEQQSISATFPEESVEYESVVTEYPVVPPPPPYGAPQPQYYQGYPPPYAYPPPAAESKGGGIPTFVWIGVGILIATAWGKVTSFFSGGPGGAQDKMAAMMMQQMMSSMSKGGGPGGANAPNPFAGFTPPAPSRPGGGLGYGPGSSSPPIDTTARAVETPTASSPSTSEAFKADAEAPSQRGARFEEAKAKERERRRKKSAFADVGSDSDNGASQNGSNGASAAGAGSAGAGGDASNFTTEMLETIMRDPAMQEMLYKYLPESMRNPETFEYMLNTPEYRQQLENLVQQQGLNMPPDMMDMMKGMDTEEVNRQLDGLGLTPADVIKRIMEEPDLAAAFQKPNVMKAILESQKNPLAIMNYQDDPDVMLVFERMATMVSAGRGTRKAPVTSSFFQL